MEGDQVNDNAFFKPTQRYKEYMILDIIEKNAKVTQREIAHTLGVAVSMINVYLDEYEKNGYLKKKYTSAKVIEYVITKKGVERKKVLNISYLSASLNVYKSAKVNIEDFLSQIIDKGYKNILLYGAGEVAEILLQSILIDSQSQVNVLAVIDDDVLKQGKNLVSSKIISVSSIEEYAYDGILISSYTNQKKIFDKLMAMGYKKSNILHFFN